MDVALQGRCTSHAFAVSRHRRTQQPMVEGNTADAAKGIPRASDANINIGVQFYATPDDGNRYEVYSRDGGLLARNATWAVGVVNDPSRIVVGDDRDNVCEIIVDADGEALTVHRLGNADRWKEFGTDGEIEVGDEIYLPSQPQYRELQERKEQAVEDVPPWRGTFFAVDMADTFEESIPPSEAVECNLCNRGTPAEIRIVAWNGRVVFGRAITKEKIENELCIACLDLFPSADRVDEYRRRAGDFPIDFKTAIPGWSEDNEVDSRPEPPMDDTDPIPSKKVLERHLDKQPKGRVWAGDGSWDAAFTVYLIDPDPDVERKDDCSEYHIVAELAYDSDTVEVEDASMVAESPENALRSARRLYESFWSGPTDDRRLNLTVKRTETR